MRMNCRIVSRALPKPQFPPTILLGEERRAGTRADGEISTNWRIEKSHSAPKELSALGREEKGETGR